MPRVSTPKRWLVTHVAVAMHGGFRLSGRAGRVEPKAIVLGICRHRIEARPGSGQQCRQGRFVAVRPENAARPPRGRRDAWLDFGGELRRVDDCGSPGIVDHECVGRLPQQGIDGDRHDPGLDRSPELVEERRAILDHHEHALARLQSEADEHSRAAVDASRESRISDIAMERADCRLAPAAFGNVPIDERNRDIEAGRKPQRRRFLRPLDFDDAAAHVSCPRAEIQPIGMAIPIARLAAAGHARHDFSQVAGAFGLGKPDGVAQQGRRARGSAQPKAPVAPSHTLRRAPRMALRSSDAS